MSDIEISHNANVIIVEDQALLEERLALSARQQHVSIGDYKKALGNAIVGTPEECVEQIRRYVDAGITYFFLLFPHPVALEDVRLFAEAVMPAFAQSSLE